MARTHLEESLLCIRCGACLNACPVYRQIGGHAYDSVYQGPIGSVLSPALFGVAEFGHLAKASSLCGACEEACPVGVRLPELLLRVRDEYTQAAPQPIWMRWGMRAYAWTVVSPGRYRLAQAAAAFAARFVPRRAGWITRLPAPLSGWTSSRHFPAFQFRPFRDRYARLQPAAPRPAGRRMEPTRPNADVSLPLAAEAPIDRFEREVRALGGEVIRCAAEDAPVRAAEAMRLLGVRSMIAWGGGDPVLDAVCEACARTGMAISTPSIPAEMGEPRQAILLEAAHADAGLTGAKAALADTGTLILPAGPGRPSIASLLPPLHLAVLRSRDIYPSLEGWLEAGGRSTIMHAPTIAMISGPSRTADIEMTLTVGVHGPGKLIVLCVG